MAQVNPRIESLLTGNLHIDAWDALDAYAQYLRELDYLAAGGSYAELGFAERRKQTRPSVLGLSASGDLQHSPVVARSQEDGIEELFDADSREQYNAYFKDRVVMLELKGVMRSEGGPSSYGVADLAQMISYYGTLSGVKGLLLRVRSGGGESMSADLLRSAIQTVSKPVVAYTDRMGSAALYGTIDADEIIASGNRARIGSIGSYISLDRKLIEQYRESILDVYSDLSPDKNAEFRELLAGNLEPLRSMVRTDADEFREDVRALRPLKGSKRTIEETLSGGMFPAQDAKRRGLIDGIGTLNYAVRRVLTLAQRA